MALLARHLFTGILACGAWTSAAAALSPFAVEVVEYTPAPGKYVNDADFEIPARALGEPSGGGTFQPDNLSAVTLGGFGGSITLRFDHMVEDHPLNPFGMDAIVFGNAYWVDSEAARHWAECATIEIALDVDENGWIDEDEGWYLIPGSHITDPTGQTETQTWDTDLDDPTYPPALSDWLPPEAPEIWTTRGIRLPPGIFDSWIITNPSPEDEVEGIYGYGDYTPTLILGDMDGDNVIDEPGITPEEFYTVPDDPFTVGITPESGGGDAFDIASAIDPDSGLPANLPGFDFIRLTNGVNVMFEFFGEKSPEIDAVADVEPDPFGDCDGDQDRDLADASWMQNCFGQWIGIDDPCAPMDRDADGFVGGIDTAAFVQLLTGPR